MPAGLGARFAALAIDAIVATGLFLALIAVAIVVTDSFNDTGLALLSVGYVVLILYAPLLMMRRGAHNGQTVGKQLLGIRVTRVNGKPVGFWSGVLRELLAKGVLGPLTLGIDFLWPLWDDRRQALHDKVAGTVVQRL